MGASRTSRQRTTRRTGTSSSRARSSSQRRGRAQQTRTRSLAKSSRSRTAKSRKRPTRRGSRKRRFAHHGIAIVITAAVIAIAAVLIFAAASYNNTQSKYDACAKWHDTVQEACIKTGLGKGWTDDVLALMFIESGGDTSVSSVTGVANDIMQAAEGEYGDIIRSGSEKYGVEAETPEASIYAGVLEFKQNLKLWDDYLGGVGPAETGKVQLVIQGYNFGADGWYQWCVENDYTIYTVERAQRYSDTMMPSDAKGTPTHAEKWLTAYEKIKADEAE